MDITLPSIPLPRNNTELTQFVLAGNTFFNFKGTDNSSWYHAYYQSTVHIAENLFLVERASYMQYDTIELVMRGTNEHVLLNRYDQSDRLLFRVLVEQVILTEFRHAVYNSS